MRTPRLQGDVRRDQIVQAVLALAAENGLGAVSVATVAHRVGVAPSALYRHYPSKDAMLAGMLERLGTRLLDNIERARAGSADPLAALERLLFLQIEVIRENRGLPFVLFSETLTRNPAHRRALLAFVSRFRAALSHLVRTAQEAGKVRPELDPELVSVHFIGLYVPAAILWNVTGGRFDINAHARHAWDVFHQGIRTPAAGSAPAAGRAPRPHPRRRKA